MTTTGTTSGPELLVELDRGAGGLGAQLEERLRGAVRSGRLRPGTRLPASRVLAADLGVSRRLVVDSYAQLAAEGYVSARRGAGTFIHAAAAPSPPAAPSRGNPHRALRFDFFPGAPDLAGFPRGAWLRALGHAVRTVPDADLGYPDPQGARALREALAAHLGRVRGVAAAPESIVVCAGCAQALALLGRVLVARGRSRVAVEDPCLPEHRAILASTGVAVRPVRVDGDGLRVDELAREPADAVLVTPAHQAPTGVALAPARRTALLGWAREGGLVVEDDYDAEFRYDRAPIGALQGLAPERVAYVGSVSKTLAPGLRLGWLVLPPALVEEVVAARRLDDLGSPTLDQLALAHLFATAAYDRHVRLARRTNRRRRDALVAAVARELPGARVDGLAAGLHAIVRLGVPGEDRALVRAARRRSVGIYPLAWAYAEPHGRPGGELVLGYANLTEAAIAEGVRRLAGAVEEAGSGQGTGGRGEARTESSPLPPAAPPKAGDLPTAHCPPERAAVDGGR